MKDILVLYKSKYGATERYAEWIAEELQCDIGEIGKADIKTMMSYKILIFGGGLYAGRINGATALTKRFAQLSEKTLFIFTAGLTQPDDKGYYTNLFTRNFTEKMRKQIYFFSFPGQLDKDRLSPMDRVLMKAVMKKRAKEDPQNAETYLSMKFDMVDRRYIDPLVNKVRAILSGR